MSNELNQQMDTLLREAAKKRTAEAGEPFELHPVNRQALQDEVTRTFAPVKPAVAKLGWTELLMALLPRVAFGVGIFMVLGITVYMSLPRPSNRAQTFELSKVEPSSKPEELPLNPTPATPPGVGEGLASTKSAPAGAASQPMPTAVMSAESGTVARHGQTTPAPAAPMPAGGSGQIAQRADVLSKAQTRTESENLLSQARDADALSKDKADTTLRSRGISPVPASRGAVSTEASKDMAAVDEKSRGFSAPKPAAQRMMTPPAAQNLADARPSGTALDQLKRSSEVDAPALPSEARKKEVALNEGVTRQQSAAPSAPVKQLPERKAANDASALYFKESLPTAKPDPALMALADSTPPIAKSDEQTDRFNFVQQDSRSMYRRNLQSPPLPKVLTRFSVVIADGHVTVTDVDGSVYSGSPVAGGAMSGSPGGMNGVRIRVSGTNRKSGQKVTIDGTFDTGSSKAELAARNRPLSTGGRLAGATAAASDGAIGGLQFQGRVTVGATQFEIQAVRASSQP